MGSTEAVVQRRANSLSEMQKLMVEKACEQEVCFGSLKRERLWQ